MTDGVVDNRVHNRYELTVDGATAFVAYAREPGVITFIHTVVPEALAGRGIGSILATHVLDDARANGEKVIPQCPFIAAYIRRHQQYQDLVVA
ncbi:MAG TPA: GNAT family N-acetyltransferase [Rudaea sp.]|uniref:GNAT family N-acetyltransferase n=1 Tax=Rudaea sp. TaxID=2136325 RepID=UPI002F95A245